LQAQNDQRAKIATLEKCVTTQENLIKCQAEKLKQQGSIVHNFISAENFYS
jgi:precorrin-6B methylase 2